MRLGPLIRQRRRLCLLIYRRRGGLEGLAVCNRGGLCELKSPLVALSPEGGFFVPVGSELAACSHWEEGFEFGLETGSAYQGHIAPLAEEGSESAEMVERKLDEPLSEACLLDTVPPESPSMTGTCSNCLRCSACSR